jgi:putative lipoprotein (rSAM/lipoprotein system)
MYRKWLKLFDKAIIALLGFTGLLSSCYIVIEEPAAYGMPSADFVLKGTVTDGASSQPIRNIRVVRPFVEYAYGPEGIGYTQAGDTVYTDKDGKFAFEYGDDSFIMQYRLKLEDIDGVENGGKFRSKDVEGEFTEVNRDRGKFVKTQNITLDLDNNVPVPAYGIRPAPYQP